MDPVDREILKHLRADGRLSLRRLGARVHLSAPAVAARLSRLEDTGVIARYTIETRLPRPPVITTFIDVIMKTNDHAAFARFVTEQPEVKRCYRTSGDTCYVLRVESADQTSLGLFLDKLLRYANYRTHTVISTVLEREDTEE